MKLSKGKYEPGTYAINIIRGKTNSFGQVQYKIAYLIIVTRIIIVEDDRSTNGYIGRAWLSRERITVPSIIVFFLFDFFQHRLFRSIILEIWTKCTFCLRGGNASKKIVIINRQAFDATNRAEIFLLPFRIANTIGKEVKLCRYSPTS